MVEPDPPVENPVMREEDEDSEVGWEDAEPDEADEGVQFVGFFHQKAYGSLREMLEATKKEHEFDFIDVVKQLGKCCVNLNRMNTWYQTIMAFLELSKAS
jgi:hypothetical protein